MKATYTKLKDGSWGIRTIGGIPAKEASVAVRKKDGSSKQEIVSVVLWKGQDEQGRQIALCKISEEREGSSRGGYSGSYCGYACPVSGRRCNAKNGPCHDCE